MRTWFVIPSLIAAAASLVALDSVTREQAPSADLHAAGHTREVQRIQAHFDSVVHELETREVLTPAADSRHKRAALITTLRAYRDRGAFPHNYDFPDTPTPYFVDRHTGVLCAVAHLLESTGRRDIVDRVAAMDNNVWVAQLAGDTEFEGWLDAHGITLAEAARIQVPYVGDGNPIVSAMGSRDNTYGAGTALMVGLSGATALWNAKGNADGHRRLGTVLGLTTGVLAMGFGGAAMGDPAAPRYIAPASLVSGVAATFLSTRGLLRHRSEMAARRNAATTGRGAQVSLAPIVPVTGKGAGLSLNVSF